ncbi:MAG: tRNA (guanosine(46)-N7)-methyltransferase TrmB [Cyanobium sp.]
MRQHVNPLSRIHQQPRPLPPVAELFADPGLPLHLDIGCARGRLLIELAALQPAWNHLGVEIRRPLVDAAEAERLQLGLVNLRLLFCNANVSLQPWLAQLPAGQLQRVSIQFPDPWFKTKHHKRRVLQPPLLLALASALPEGGWLFLQSDVAAVITPMLELCVASGCFDRPAGDACPWHTDSPLPVASERERHALAHGLPVQRVLLLRNGAAVPTQEMLQASLESRQQATDNPADSGP